MSLPPLLPREVLAGLDPVVLAAGPPPAPLLTDPWSVRPLCPDGGDPALISRWMNEPHVALFWEQAWPAERWAAVIAGQQAGDYSRPFLVSYEGCPLAYIEIYRTPRDVVGRQYPAEPYDLGLHLAIGESACTGRGLGRSMVRAIAEGLAAADPRVRRVLADPDERHLIARRMFRAAGFHQLGVRDLGHKHAALVSYDLSGSADRGSGR